MCVSCDVLPHTVDLLPGLVYVSIVICYHTLSTCFLVLYLCQLSCVTTHYTVDLFPGLVFVSIVMCYHTLHCRPVSWSCICVNCHVLPHTTLSTCFRVLYLCQLSCVTTHYTVDLFPGLVFVSIVMCYHTLHCRPVSGS